MTKHRDGHQSVPSNRASILSAVRMLKDVEDRKFAIKIVFPTKEDLWS